MKIIVNKINHQKMNQFAISDIHGCLDSFKALLKQINFSKNDQLYLLGDYIDRGPNSKGVIDYIWQLEKEGYRIKCLRGNHEENLIESIQKPSVFYKGERATLASFGVSNNQDIPEKYINWISKLPYYFELNDFILVHAGLDFNANDPFANKQELIWVRYWYDDIDFKWLGNRIIIHGHTPTKQLIIKKSMQTLDTIPAINIDAGCVFQGFGLGYLCALRLNDLKLYFLRRVEAV